MKQREFSRHLAVAAVVLLAACSQKKPANPMVAAAVAKFDQEMQALDARRATLAGPESGAQKDFRGLTIDDDLERWFLPPDTRREIDRLRTRALESPYANDAEQLLSQARRRANDDADRATQIQDYWNSNLPAPYWRRYWHDLYAFNGVPAEEPDPMLVSIERRITSSLGAGDFRSAAKSEEELNAVFEEAMSRATNRINGKRERRTDFTPRKTPCPTELEKPAGDRAKLIRGDSIDAFYPKDAINRGETGSVVLRAKIDAKGCATAVVVQVRSAVPSLDNAALDWFETGRFSPAAQNGKPVDSELVWKLRFTLK